MNNVITPIKNAYGKVMDFIVEHECADCKRRKERLKKGVRSVSKATRDLLRRPQRK